MRAPATFKWIGLALLGLLVAAAVAIAASNLASRQIGLASEPISAGYALSPAGHDERQSQRERVRQARGGHEREAGETAIEPEATTPGEPLEPEAGGGETASPETTPPAPNRQSDTAPPTDRSAEPQTAAPVTPTPSPPAQPATTAPTAPPPESDGGTEPEPDD
jgi:hypothetical protein